MVVNNKLKEINIKDGSYYYLGNLIDINSIVPKNIIEDKKNHTKIF